MTELEKTLSEALTYAKIFELPQKANERDGDWLKAVALVVKANNRRSYAIVNNDGTGNPRVSVDFGAPVAIREILEIYPYLKKAKNVDLDFSTDELKLNFLSSAGVDCGPVKALLSDTYKNGRKKAKEKLDADRASVMSMIDRIIATQEAQRMRDEKEEMEFYSQTNDC